MGRKRKMAKYDSFFTVLDDNNDNVRSPYAEVKELNNSVAKACEECGSQPRLHHVHFCDPNYKNGYDFYVDCKCGCCDGEWYDSVESAIDAWNAKNPNGVPRKVGTTDMIDFLEQHIDFKIPKW